MSMNKQKGRLAKRMAFYALNRRKVLGRSVPQEIRLVTRSGKPLALPLLEGDWCTAVMVPMTGAA